MHLLAKLHKQAHNQCRKCLTSNPALPDPHQVDVYTPFQAVLRHMWTLWELVLLAEPLLVAAPTPGECAGAVAALLSLTAPLPYAADFRPFYTVSPRIGHSRLQAGIKRSALGHCLHICKAHHLAATRVCFIAAYDPRCSLGRAKHSVDFKKACGRANSWNNLSLSCALHGFTICQPLCCPNHMHQHRSMTHQHAT